MSRLARCSPLAALAVVLAALVVRAQDTPAVAELVAVFEGGRRTGETTRETARARGLTVIELADDWAPRVLSEDASLGALGAQPYRATYVALATEAFLGGDDPAFDRARADRYFELFGISPSLGVVRARLGDSARHACHAAIDDATLARLEGPVRPWGDLDVRRRFVRTHDNARAALAQLTDPARIARVQAQLEESAPKVDGIRAVQAHLRCEGYLSRRAEDALFDRATSDALRSWQRRHMIPSVPGTLDAVTRDSLVADSLELDFRQLLRALRERVVDATGVIEDGSAAGQFGTVLGRALDAPDLHDVERDGPLPGGAPDLVSPATEAAARALGWTSPEAARAALGGLGAVAVRLPPRPAYHGAQMELRAEIDRGDVWYDFPYDERGRARAQPVRRRPTLVLYARDGERDIPLVRYRTTIGGWKTEQLPGGSLGLRYKGSDVGPRLWRDVIASPAWLPPPTTPERDLVRRHGTRWVANDDLSGPGYASAYGLVMLVHHQELPKRTDAGGQVTELFDRGIRAHGSVSYASILRGQSHGCHRLFNHLAVRLSGFVLAHRAFVRRGPAPVRYRRVFARYGGAVLRIAQRGVVFELTPPVPVNVLVGTVHGRAQSPIDGLRPLQSALVARAREAAAGADD